MRRAGVVWLLLSLALIFPVTNLSQPRDNDFKVFWEKFKEAVIKGDKSTVASLSKFPLGMSYGIRSVKSRAELIRRYREVFKQQTDAAKCFTQKLPQKDQSNSRLYSVACPDEAGNEVVVYEFQRGSSGWKFIRLDNLNE